MKGNTYILFVTRKLHIVASTTALGIHVLSHFYCFLVLFWGRLFRHSFDTGSAHRQEKWVKTQTESSLLRECYWGMRSRHSTTGPPPFFRHLIMWIEQSEHKMRFTNVLFGYTQTLIIGYYSSLSYSVSFVPGFSPYPQDLTVPVSPGGFFLLKPRSSFPLSSSACSQGLIWLLGCSRYYCLYLTDFGLRQPFLWFGAIKIKLNWMNEQAHASLLCCKFSVG